MKPGAEPAAPGVGLILGSAWQSPTLGGRGLVPFRVDTRFGPVTLHRWPGRPSAWVLFRHGAPHRWLPNQIPYRAQALAFAAVGVGAVLLTSSVGVMDPTVPLFTPLPVSDLLMPDNRLPDGSACSLFVEPDPDQGHLVTVDGLFNSSLRRQIARLAAGVGHPLGDPVVFTYVGGPRTKTPAENAWFIRLGAQVNSMTVGPEAVLLNEAEIAVAAVVVGHKHSHPDRRDGLDRTTIAASLDHSRAAVSALAIAWLDQGQAVPFANRLHRFDHA